MDYVFPIDASIATTMLELAVDEWEFSTNSQSRKYWFVLLEVKMFNRKGIGEIDIYYTDNLHSNNWDTSSSKIYLGSIDYTTGHTPTKNIYYGLILPKENPLRWTILLVK